MNYGNVLKKKNLDKEAAIAEATAFGWEISEEQFEVKARKRDALSRQALLTLRTRRPRRSVDVLARRRGLLAVMRTTLSGS